jgi:YHS domain-containing protein
MKTGIFLVSGFLMFFALVTNTSNSQDKGCCENKTSSCCVEKSDCCTKDGNAGGDSTVSGLTCPVSGEAIGEGQGVKFEYYGKTYTFCCEGCEAKFRKEPFSYLKEEINCPVMGEPIVKDVFVMHNGTKYYLCCKSCLKKFENDPEKYIKGAGKE